MIIVWKLSHKNYGGYQPSSVFFFLSTQFLFQSREGECSWGEGIRESAGLAGYLSPVKHYLVAIVIA